MGNCCYRMKNKIGEEGWMSCRPNWSIFWGITISQSLETRPTDWLTDPPTDMGNCYYRIKNKMEKKAECPVAPIGPLMAGLPDGLSALQTLAGNQPSSNVQSAETRSASSQLVKKAEKSWWAFISIDPTPTLGRRCSLSSQISFLTWVNWDQNI